jgi:hypothetical protein
VGTVVNEVKVVCPASSPVPDEQAGARLASKRTSEVAGRAGGARMANVVDVRRVPVYPARGSGARNLRGVLHTRHELSPE